MAMTQIHTFLWLLLFGCLQLACGGKSSTSSNPAATSANEPSDSFLEIAVSELLLSRNANDLTISWKEATADEPSSLVYSVIERSGMAIADLSELEAATELAPPTAAISRQLIESFDFEIDFVSCKIWKTFNLCRSKIGK